jgi:glyoxylase I family protein
VDHLALICSDLDATIRFYTEVVGMRLTKIVENRDEPTSTHIPRYGRQSVGIFDFPQKGPARVLRGLAYASRGA